MSVRLEVRQPKYWLSIAWRILSRTGKIQVDDRMFVFHQLVICRPNWIHVHAETLPMQSDKRTNVVLADAKDSDDRQKGKSPCGKNNSLNGVHLFPSLKIEAKREKENESWRSRREGWRWGGKTTETLVWPIFQIKSAPNRFRSANQGRDAHTLALLTALFLLPLYMDPVWTEEHLSFSPFFSCILHAPTTHPRTTIWVTELLIH